MTRIFVYVAALLMALFAGPCLARFECAKLVEQPHEQVGELRHERGLLWRISRSGVAVSYLFGTIHLGDPRVTGLPRVIRDALLASESFSMEVLMDLDTLLDLSQKMYYQDGTKLSAVVGDDLFARVAELLGGYGIPGEAAAILKPWAAYTTLSLPPGQSAVPQDMLLMLTAQQAGKSMHGLESLDEQAAVFESLPPADQVAMLAEVVCHYETLQQDVELMIEHYLARDLKGLLQMTLRYPSAHQDRLLEALLRRRNPRMLERMLPSLNEGKAFVAVGALHLPGPGGLLDLLERHGFEVEPVY